MKKLPLFLTALSILASAVPLTGCSKTVKPGDVKGYDEGEQYISMWVHTIEDTPEGEAYKASVERFNEKYDGTYFADIEFIPRNDSGGGYSDKINASVMSGDLPDVITVDGPNISAYAANGIIQPLAELSEEENRLIWIPFWSRERSMTSCMHSVPWNPVSVSIIIRRFWRKPELKCPIRITLGHSRNFWIFWSS